MDDDRNLTCDIYCRLSLAVMGDTTKVDDQERISREIAARRGWTVGLVWKDNSRSAWRRDRKRPGWDAMLERVRDGKVAAIVSYHGDRMVRQPYDLEVLLNLADRQGIRFASVVGDRDLDDADDRYILRIEAAQACRESDNTSRRLKAHHARRRRQGLTRPGGRGGRAAGFSTDGVTHISAETAYIREAADRIIAGEPTGSVSADLASRGWLTPAGSPVSHGTLKKMLMRPRYAGLMPDGTTRAAWEPVLERETWEQCCAVLAGKAAGFGYATNAPRHLLSGIAACGTCEATVQIRQSKGRRGKHPQEGYGCVNPDCARKVFRSSAHLDGHVTGIVVGLLADRRFLAALSAPGSGTAAREILVLERRRDEMRAQLADLAGHPELSPSAAVAALESFTARIGQLRDSMAVTARARLLTAHAGLTRPGWEALPLGTRRALAAAAVMVVILPATRRGPGFDPESVTVTPR